MKTKLLFALLFVGSIQLFAQIQIFGLRIYANDDEYQPPIILKEGGFVTIEFDVNTPTAPNLQILFRHVSRDWKQESNSMINNELRLRSRQLSFLPSPNGVQHYTFRYKNSFPNERNGVQFEHSGNYIFRVVDESNGDQILAEGKFVVGERIVTSSMQIKNTYYPGGGSPLNQRLTISVGVNASGMEYTASNFSTLFHPLIKHVDIIQNWKLMEPYSIDLDDNDPDTFVDDFTKPEKKFWTRSVMPGNEYRRLDISSVDFYPNNKTVRLKDGADVSRFQWQAKPDANGASKLKPFVGANSDYLDVVMRLNIVNPQEKNVYLVGAFNGWQVNENYKMKFDSVTSHLTNTITVWRGVYDYQYVVKENGNENWFALEGNDWRTISKYTALVYYRDERLGGFDRIVGMIEGKSPGGEEGKSLSFPEFKPDKKNPPINIRK